MADTKITASIVLYHDSADLVRLAIESFLRSELASSLYLVDNSATDELRCLAEDERVKYRFNGANLGFGAGHNVAIRQVLKMGLPYHLVLNPDTYFDAGVIEFLAAYMDSDPKVGMVMPRVVYPDGAFQYPCKDDPTPFDLLIRRFAPAFLKPVLKERLDRFELRHLDYDRILEVPILSGCFLFARTSMLAELDGFDERFFLYLEDYDLCRRAAKNWQLVYHPSVEITHYYHGHSYLRLRPLLIHITSAIKYFNKWGWFPLS